MAVLHFYRDGNNSRIQKPDVHGEEKQGERSGEVTDWERTYKDLSGGNWFILLIISSISYFIMSHKFTLGVILGGLIIIANFHVLQSTMSRTVSVIGGKKSGRVWIIVKSLMRLLFLGVSIFILITRDLVNPIGLTIGLSTLFLSIVAFAIKNIGKSRIGGAV